MNYPVSHQNIEGNLFPSVLVLKLSLKPMIIKWAKRWKALKEDSLHFRKLKLFNLPHLRSMYSDSACMFYSLHYFPALTFFLQITISKEQNYILKLPLKISLIRSHLAISKTKFQMFSIIVS